MLKDKVRPVDPEYDVGPKKRPKKGPPYQELVLLLLPIFAAILAAWAMLNLQPEVDGAALFKSGLVGVVVGIVSYCINRFAIDWGTELFAAGYVSAGLFSIASMMIVGACLWLFSFGGIVLPDARLLKHEDHGLALNQYLAARQEEASKALRIVPVVAAAKDDLAFHANCERREGCISGRGGGTGTLSRSLDERAARAGAISEQLAAGTQNLTQIVNQANGVLADYQKVLNDDTLSGKDRRQKLIELDGAFGQAVSGLNEAVPTSLLSAYAQELNSGVVIPNRAEATAKVNALLRKHGQAIQSVLGSIEREAIAQPTFPGKVGLSDTLTYIGNFAPLAGVIWVAEGIFPLALWLYILLFMLRQRERIEEEKSSGPAASAWQMAGANVVDLHNDAGDRVAGDDTTDLVAANGINDVPMEEMPDPVTTLPSNNRKIRRRKAKMQVNGASSASSGAPQPSRTNETGSDPGALNGLMSAQSGEVE